MFGDPNNDAESWSIDFSNDDFTEFLFASGDEEIWMRMMRDDVLGWYDGQ